MESSASEPSLQTECIWKSPRYFVREGVPRRDRISRTAARLRKCWRRRAQLRDFLLLARLAHRALDKRRRSLVNQLAREPIGRRTDPGHRLEGVGVHERGDVPVQTKNGFGGALVAPPALAVACHRRHVEEQPGQVEIDVGHGNEAPSNRRVNEAPGKRSFVTRCAAAAAAAPRQLPGVRQNLPISHSALEDVVMLQSPVPPALSSAFMFHEPETRTAASSSLTVFGSGLGLGRGPDCSRRRAMPVATTSGGLEWLRSRGMLMWSGPAG